MTQNQPAQSTSLTQRTAIRFIILLGLVSLFADVTYEGARSITGPYLLILGASGTVVGVVAGLGELVGYIIRLFSGYVSDRIRSYWAITLIGYAINLFAVPLLALINYWPTAAALIILERFGKGIRSPPRDAMLSYATHTIGRGWGFGLHQMLDQIGAVVGPLLIAAILYFRGTYAMSFGILLIPALIAFILLVSARWLYSHPEELEIASPSIKVEDEGFKRSYWLYVWATSLIAAGYVDFPLMAYYFQQQRITSPMWIPIVYAIAMAVEGVASLLLGKWLDRQGIIVLILSTAVSALFAPLVFLGNFTWIVVGMILWGIGMGAQGSIMKAIIVHLVGSHQRATAFGIFNLWFGIFWFVGSAWMGYLYDHFLAGLIIFSVGMQWASLPILWVIKRQEAGI